MRSPAGSEDNTPENKSDPQNDQSNNVLTFFQMLFDFSFSKFITVQMFPALYFVILASTLFAILYLCFEAFLISAARGLFFLFVAGPITFIAIATVIRALMEFYIVIFRVAENVEEVRIASEKLMGFTDTMDEFKGLTRKLPFWNLKSNKTADKETPSFDEPEASPRTKAKSKKNANWPY
ncbi:hypothetical protein A9Q99_06845 [Gammaproteobacteria bacterium 45_16_T64]|nr:hypothetical protein A9Q99_06845 [Gammaproteobacteria bacterium 45_16_T64]